MKEFNYTLDENRAKNKDIGKITLQKGFSMSESEESVKKEKGDCFYYKQLKSMVDAGTLDIKLILSPPRTGSTLMESSFSQNPLIDAQAHEPFIVSRKGDVEAGYKTIYDIVFSISNSFPKQKQVVVKEMTQWLFINNEYERFLTLIKSPIVVLVRNPLLNTESRIKKILETLGLREKQAIQETLLNYYAQSKGEKNWKMFLNRYEHVPDRKIDDEAIKIYRKIENLKDSPEQAESEVFPLQRWLLDYYAILKGHKWWKVMLNKECDNCDYKQFEEILLDERIYGVERTGWKATFEIVQYLEKNGKQLIIVDSSDYRLDPKTIVSILCKKWNIPFSEKMIHWGEKGLGLYTGQTKSHQSIWYDRLQQSKNIEPPTEIVPTIEDFPDFIVGRLINIDFPAYLSMINSPLRIKPKEQIFDEKIRVPVKRKIYKRLKDLGLLSEDMDLKNREEDDQEIFDILSQKGVLNYPSEEFISLREAYLKGEATINLTIQNIDPVFAYLSNPKVLDDLEFRRINYRYLPTLETIKKIQENKFS